jgi:hypothetical protein
VFTNARHDHAITETAPGHSVMLSGRFPRGTGIARRSPTGSATKILAPARCRSRVRTAGPFFRLENRSRVSFGTRPMGDSPRARTTPTRSRTG